MFAGARSIGRMKPLTALGIDILQLDVTDRESIQRAKDHIVEKTGGKLDILYNNAGISLVGSVFDISKESLQSSFNVNVIGTVEILQVFQNVLIQNKTTVAFTGSGTEYVISPFMFAYASSKQSFGTLSKSLALETQHFGIKIIHVLTGAVHSDIWGFDTSKIPEDTIYKDKDNNLVLKTFGSEKATPTAEYTKKVIDDIEKIIKKNTNQNYFEIFHGDSINFAWFIGTFFPFNWFKSIALKKLGLNEILKDIAKRFQSKKTV